MTILLTGGAGYIGSHTIIELINKGYDVIVVDNYDNSSPEAIKRVKKITGADFPVYLTDICNEAALDNIFAKHKIDCVIHFAGLKAVGESCSIPLKYYENNLIGTIVLAKVMAKHNVKKLIFSSSATVYSSVNNPPLTEASLTGNCSNPYGWTKYMNEQILRDTAKADDSWSIVLLRYFNPIGAHESGLIGEDPAGIPNNLFPYITQVAVGKRPKLNIFGNDYPTPDGTCIRDYIHVVDLAKGHVAAIEYLDKLKGSDEINLGTGNGYSVLDMVKAFEKANNLTLPYEIAPRRPGDLATVYSDPSKAKKILNWQAEKTLEDMCRDSWRWQSTNPNGYGKG